jgi:uncharacterized repeat protein (TIGR03803 family)
MVRKMKCSDNIVNKSGRKVNRSGKGENVLPSLPQCWYAKRINQRWNIVKPHFSGCQILLRLIAARPVNGFRSRFLPVVCLFFSAAFLLAAATTTSAQTYNAIYNFSNNEPNDLLLSGSQFYGTTFYGGLYGQGMVIKINTNGTGFTALHSFNPINSDGGNPFGAVILSGSTLYGTAALGGNSYGAGTVYQVDTDGSAYTNLYSFVPWVGATPIGSLVLSASKLYGMTQNDSSGFNFGTVFRINADGSNGTELHVFQGFPDASFPQGSLILAASTLYGTTTYGGTNDNGTVFKINTDGTGYSILHSFSDAPSDGKWPYSSLILSGPTLYGTTQQGGFNNGTVFKINTNGTGFAVLHEFGLTVGDGYWPECALVLTGSTLYGTTTKGGTNGINGYGTVFQINTNGSGYQTLFNFLAFSGPPKGSLILSGSTLFGLGGEEQGTRLFSLTSLPGPLPLLEITTPDPLSTGTVGVAYSQSLAGSGGTPPYVWTQVFGDLPPGLTLISSGSITGTPTVATNATFTLSVADATGSNSVNKAFSLVVIDTNTNVPASFPAWQLQYFGCTNCSQASQSADPDGDGQSNVQEFQTGTDPTNSVSAFRIVSILPNGIDLLVTWTTGVGRTNALQATAGDASGSYNTNGFADIFTVTNTVGTSTNYLDVGAATNVPSRFYRVRLVP